MTILVTGANGQLGSTIRKSAQTDIHRYIYSDVNTVSGQDTIYLDVTDADAVRSLVSEYNVNVIINCSGYTNVDKAEEDYQVCNLLNAVAPENLAKVMKEVGGLLVHISSDYVFGGNSYNTPCCEDQEGTPTGVYGLTKLKGEKAILSSGCDYVIIRTAWLHSEFGNNFVKTMMHLTATKPELKVVFDQVGTPTYALDLAEAIGVVLSDYKKFFISSERVQEEKSMYDKSGIYHYSNEGVCSWYDFAKMIAEYAGHTACAIKPCHSDEFPSKVKRPSYSVLDKTRIKEIFGLDIPYWTESLKKCIMSLQ